MLTMLADADAVVTAMECDGEAHQRHLPDRRAGAYGMTQYHIAIRAAAIGNAVYHATGPRVRELSITQPAPGVICLRAKEEKDAED